MHLLFPWLSPSLKISAPFPPPGGGQFYLLLLLCIRTIWASNLPLLSASLKTFQVHACDGEELKLECLQNTVISIYVAQYGRTGFNANSLCPDSRATGSIHQPSDNPTSSSSSVLPTSLQSSTPVHKDSGTSEEEIKCLTTESLRYSLLQKVEAACREQRVCNIMTNPKSFGGIDPCPGVRKYAEVAYKCRPNTFSNKVVCEGDQLRLKCDKSYLIVIYSASYGSTRYDVPECPQVSTTRSTNEETSGTARSSFKIKENCLVSYATEKVMNACHGKRQCSLLANNATFGNPGCKENIRTHLKVVYTCLQREVLIDNIGGEAPTEKSATDFTSTTVNHVESSTESTVVDKTMEGFVEAPRYSSETAKIAPHPLSPTVYYSESYVKVKDVTSTKSPDSHAVINDSHVHETDQHENCTHLMSPERAIGFLSDWISAYRFIKSNSLQLLLYLVVSVCVALLSLFLFLSFKFYLYQKRSRKSTSNNGKKTNSKKRDSLASSPFAGFGNDDNISDDILGELESRTITTIPDPIQLHNTNHKRHGHSHHHHHHHHHHHSMPPEVIRYTSSPTSGTGTLSRAARSYGITRQDSDTHPKAMSGSVNSYF